MFDAVLNFYAVEIITAGFRGYLGYEKPYHRSSWSFECNPVEINLVHSSLNSLWNEFFTECIGWQAEPA
jgi:hypothetical protein